MNNQVRVVCAIVIATSLIIPEARAAVKPGAKCVKQGATTTSKSKKYTCIKNGKKLVWNKGVIVKRPASGSIDTSVSVTPDPLPTLTDPLSADVVSALIGMTEKNAKAYALSKGWGFRVGERNGEMFPVTMDYRPDRVTILIKNDLVYQVMVG
ncbi:MAG: hypothetical protein D4R83_03785 [Streptomycetaceae bacterium]|nr:MAG: hypothetical protein D4R83_03785 [Streptomycetaceae bacterium]